MDSYIDRDSYNALYKVRIGNDYLKANLKRLLFYLCNLGS